MIMFMAYEDTLAGTAHSMLFIVFLETFESGENRGIFFWLVFFCAECVVAERVETDGFWLIAVEGFG